MKLIRAILAVILACAGCANNEALRTAASASPVATHKQLSQLPFVPLTKGAPRIEEITPQTSAFEFREGLSYFKAYAIAPNENDRRIQLTTFIVGTMHMPSAFVFYPHFTFLNDSFGVIGRIDPKLTYKNNFWDSTRSGWGAEVTVPVEARYAVIHSPSSKRGSRIYYKDASYAPPGSVVPLGKGVMYLPGNWWDVYLPASGAGRFQIELQ